MAAEYTHMHVYKLHPLLYEGRARIRTEAEKGVASFKGRVVCMHGYIANLKRRFQNGRGKDPFK